jgi:ubiquinone biosynthesis monooxygenase Coq6
LVGADGINSPVRRWAGITTDGWDYDRHGVVATLSLSEPVSPAFPTGTRTAYQRFLPSLGGPVALLPLPNNTATLVWSTTVENAAYLKSLSPRAFIAMVNAAFRLSMADLKYMINMERPANPIADAENPHEDELTWRLQHTPQPSHIPPMVNGVQEGSVASFPLRFRHASSYISPRVALVGDAAHVIHPLAGQGLNLGLGDVASLSKTIEYAVNHGMDVGDILTLERYAAERYATNAKIGAACDVLHKLYNVPGQGPVTWARSFGLDVIDRLPFVKSFLMKNAQG